MAVNLPTGDLPSQPITDELDEAELETAHVVVMSCLTATLSFLFLNLGTWKAFSSLQSVLKGSRKQPQLHQEAPILTAFLFAKAFAAQIAVVPGGPREL